MDTKSLNYKWTPLLTFFSIVVALIDCGIVDWRVALGIFWLVKLNIPRWSPHKIKHDATATNTKAHSYVISQTPQPHIRYNAYVPAIHIPRRSIKTCLVPLMGNPRSFSKFFNSGTFNLVISPRSLIFNKRMYGMSYKSKGDRKGRNRLVHHIP